MSELKYKGDTMYLGNKVDIDGNVIETVDNPEFIEVTTDSENKIVNAITKEGEGIVGGVNVNQLKREVDAIDPESIKQEVKDAIDEAIGDIEEIAECFDVIDDPEKRLEVETDKDGKIISYRKEDGTKIENVGLHAKKITSESMTLPEDALQQVEEKIEKFLPKNWYLPKFGKVDIKQETFYLTADERWNTKDDVVCIQMLDDTDANAAQRLTLSYYYIKSTLTPIAGGGYDRTSVNENSVRLELFPAKEVVESGGRYYVKKITKVEGNYYYTSTLEKSESGGVTTYSLKYLYGEVVSTKVEYNDSNPDQTTLTNAVEVMQVTDSPQYKAWPVTKDLEHYCIADIDFDSFYKKNNVAVGIKYQGSGSTRYVKRGLRITFYKNNTYAKKEKVKIGEMVRLSGYNMKSYYQDNTRVNDPVLSNLFIEIWETRGTDKCYPWNKDQTPYNGATGFIKSFPIETYFGGEFFGLQFFGLKKDERNYMLDGDDDSSGIFAIGDVQKDFYQANHTYCVDEMMDDMSQETADALDELFKYTTGFVDGTIEIDGQQVDFTNDMLEEHIDIESWIDYWIGCQVFVLWDSTFHNAVIYSGRDKKKFYLFFYDLDLAEVGTQGSLIDIMATSFPWVATPKFWIKFTDVYKDNILNRYAELRKKVLTTDNITAIYDAYISGIPDRVIDAEKSKWKGSPENFRTTIELINNRLGYLDNNYFCLNI